MTNTSRKIQKVIDVYINGEYRRTLSEDKVDEFCINYFSGFRSSDSEIELKTFYRVYHECE
jgi:hypothetical protein